MTALFVDEVPAPVAPNRSERLDQVAAIARAAFPASIVVDRVARSRMLSARFRCSWQGLEQRGCSISVRTIGDERVLYARADR